MSDFDELDEVFEPKQIVLSDLLNRVLDQGVVISADIRISIADIDLIQLDLKLVVSSIAALMTRAEKLAHVPVRSRPPR